MTDSSHDSDSDRTSPRDELRREFEDARAQFDAANERLEQRVGRNLPAAIAVGIALGGLVVGSLAIAPWLFVLLIMAAAGFAGFELATALNLRNFDVMRWLVAVLTGVIPAACFVWGLGLGLVVVVIGTGIQAIVYGTRSLVTAHGIRRAIRSLAAGALTLFYVGMLSGFAGAIVAEPHGEWWIVVFLLLVVVNDTMAYVCGLTMGKHPMMPRVSPKKTWEGFLGATGSVLIVACVMGVFVLNVSWWAALVCGAFVVVTATFGDLFESIVKRDLGIKDMSSWLPGHGGILDRLDSMLLTLPLVYVAYLVLFH